MQVNWLVYTALVVIIVLLAGWLVMRRSKK